ncbi:hypothetical protein [Pseudothauera lacus]|uniref:Glycosyltransferase n=1 Tax=Pseudothauera lacus TaxID=2136175 RepID=A0A2T4IC65_9RHOO|nr:hypothetical protein [Pseudothauera lacus]PTD95351.1 hypothetical protein C8261_15160 [Pseudothauera lacus]
MNGRCADDGLDAERTCEPAPRLSVLLPVAQDAARAYAQLRLMAPLRSCGVELIASRGAAAANAAGMLRHMASRLLIVPAALPAQYNAAAAFARADVLLLLPEGVLLPSFADQLVEDALELNGGDWGWFDVRCTRGMRGWFATAWIRLRASRRAGLHRTHPLFVRRSAFMAVGGVPPDATCVPAALARRLMASAHSPVRIRTPALAGYSCLVAPATDKRTDKGREN